MTDVIKCCDFLGQAQWMAKRQHLHRNADFHAAGLRGDGASDQQRSGRDRSLWEEVQFRDPDDVETPTLSCLRLNEGLRECLCIRHPCVAWKLVKDTELEWHPASPRGAIANRLPFAKIISAGRDGANPPVGS